MEPDERQQKLQWLLGTNKFGRRRSVKSSSALLESGINKTLKNWIAEKISLFELQVSVCEKEKNFPFVKYMDVIPPHNKAQRALKRERFMWSTNHEIVYTASQRDRGFEARNLKDGKWLCVELLRFIRWKICVEQISSAVASYSEKNSCPPRHLYNNRFNKEYSKRS